MKKLILAVLLCAALLLSASALAYTYEGYTADEFAALEATTVIKSPDSPTGYIVTFRHKDDTAGRVRIFGEWIFTDPHYAGLNQSMDAAPADWQNGYVTFGTSWPTADMEKDPVTGIWSYTIPLPSGTFSYRYYVGGAADAALTDYTDAVMTWDAVYTPMVYDMAAEGMGGDEMSSTVYVPYDAEKQSESLDFSIEAPRDDQKGQAFFEAVEVSDGSKASFGVYLPYGFDAARTEPYPIFVLLHGGGGTESSWFTQGALVNIMDNMIAQGKVAPTIVIMPNCSDYPSANFVFDRPMVMSNVLNYMLPFMAEKYNAATDPAQRAFGGLSMGGATTFYALFNHTNEFKYYMPMSGFISKEYEADYTMEALKDVRICIGVGEYGFCYADIGFDFMAAEKTLTIMNNLTQAGIPYTSDVVHSGHGWVTWRHNLAYMLENFLWK